MFTLLLILEYKIQNRFFSAENFDIQIDFYIVNKMVFILFLMRLAYKTLKYYYFRM
jgi:hypothetical protein